MYCTHHSTHPHLPTDKAGDLPDIDADFVRRYARRYWASITPAEAAAERRMESAIVPARQAGELNKDLFTTIARWKSPRPLKRYLANTEQSVRSATRAAFAAETDAEAIDALRALNGVALRTATALLHWMRPHEFPILDFRVVAALGIPEPSSWEDTRFYSRVADDLRRISRQLGIDLRTLDRALWAWHKTAG